MELSDQYSDMLNFKANVFPDDLAILEEESCLAFNGGLWLLKNSLVYLEVCFLESHLK